MCFCYVAISDDISAHADFQADGYHGCWVLLLIHNILVGEITISSTWTTRVLYLYSPVHSHMFPRSKIKFINFMVIELHFFRKKKKMKQKCGKHFLKHVLRNRSTNFRILVIFHTFSTLTSLKVKSTLNWKWKSLYMVFNGDRLIPILYTQYMYAFMVSVWNDCMSTAHHLTGGIFWDRHMFFIVNQQERLSET